MKWNRFIISALMILAGIEAFADENDLSQPAETQYDIHMRNYRRYWAALIPRQFVVQNAGNMGALSSGIGWNYGKHDQWETHLMWGYIPAHQSTRGKLTTTLKENYLPWSIDLKRGWSLEPLQTSIYLNTVYGHEFWKTQPNRYPNRYYDFMSTKFRLNVALGQRVTWQIPNKKRDRAKSVSFAYEISSCDLYIRSKIVDSSVPLKDILGLSFSIIFQTL